jgi:hypothetical protein
MEQCELENNHPQHNTFIFKNGDRDIVFSSEFDSGNCGKVMQKYPHEVNIGLRFLE